MFKTYFKLKLKKEKKNNYFQSNIFVFIGLEIRKK